MTRVAARARIGLDLTRTPVEGAWQVIVREASALAPDLALHLAVKPAARSAWEAAVPGAQVHALPSPGTGLLGGAWPWLRWQRRWHLDLLHLEGSAPWWMAAPWACSLPRLPEGRQSTVQLRRLAAARLVCVPSRWAHDRLVDQMGLDPARIMVMPPGVDGVRFRPGPDGQALVRALGLEPGGYLCCVARREARKLPLTLLEAFALMPRPRPTLVLVGREGDVAHRRALEAAVQRLGLVSEVRLLDTITDTQLPAVLRHASLFVQPALACQRGTAVLEAMASGVAVVASDLPVLEERLGPAGLTVNPHDTHELAAAMLCLLADPRRRQALVQRGLARAAAHHWRGAAERLVEGWRASVTALPPSVQQPAWA